MQEEVRKTKTVDAFSISLDELEGFCSELQEEFDADTNIRIEFNFSDTVLKFNSVQEIKQNKIAYDFANNLEVRFHGRGKFALLKVAPPGGLHRPYIYSTSDRVSWCAGVNEIACRHLRRYRVWYFWIFPVYFWFVAWFSVLVVSFYTLESHPLATTAGLLGLGSLHLTKSKFFSYGKVKINQSQSFINAATIVKVITAIAIAIVAGVLSNIFS